MQNKDFDQFIQQALDNQPEPEYNPADWDALEDRLHNLHGSQPGTAGKVVSGGSSLGKLGFAATAILVTALNVVFFTQPELFKTATNKLAAVQNAILSEPETDLLPNSTPADKTAVAPVSENPVTAASTEPAAIAANPTSGNTIIENLPAVTPQENAPTIAVIKPAAGSATKTNKAKTSRNTTKPATGFAWSPSAAGQPGLITGAGLPGGKPTAAQITPCGLAKPELAAALIGNDTLRGSKIALNSCQALTATFVPKGANGNLKITSNIAKVLPGAKLVTDAASGATVLQFQPKPEMARAQAYNFTVWVTDERCPEVAVRAYQYALNLAPAFTATIAGNTKLDAGQGTTLEVSGAPVGSSYQWLVGKEVVARRESNRLVILPMKTTTYRVAVTSPAGCTVTDSVKVEVAEKQTLAADLKDIPNIFTPNGDNINDYFEVSLPEEGGIDLEVFDRYGKKVFGRKNYDNRWNAANLENGTYYYIITTQKTKRTYKGYVEVLR